MSVNHRKLGVDSRIRDLKIEFCCGVIALRNVDNYDLVNKEIRIYNLKRWAHDEICALLFGSEGTVSLQSIPGFLSDTSGVSTPDHVTVSADGGVVVYEIKTSLNKSSGAYTAATRQYLHILRSAVREYSYYCLGASPESITWDDGISLTDNQIQMIAFILQISKQIQDHLLNLGVVLDDFVLSETLINIPEVELKCDSHLSIDEKLIDYWLEMNVSAISGTKLMLEGSKLVPNIADIRKSDEIKFRNLYSEGTHINDMPFKLGVFIPTVSNSTLDSLDLEVIPNSKLRDLIYSYKTKIKSKGALSLRLSLRGRDLAEIDPDDVDVRKGLWSGMLSGKTGGLFRESGLKNKMKQIPQSTDHSTNTSKRVMSYRSKKYLPMDLDLDQISSVLFMRPNTIVKEADNTLIDGKKVRLPYQHEFWFQSTKFWQRLVEEINIGRYSSQGKWNSFHCHQICPYDAWLFVHGTGLHSHQFYFLVFHTDDPVCWPNNLCELTNGWWCTDSVKSIRTDKINQHLNILERLISLRYYWESVLGDVMRSYHHFIASFLIAFDSKQQTIDTLSLFRYIYMEFCKSAETRNPAKIVAKLPFELRSPILAWVIFRMRKLVLNSNQLQPRLKKTKQNTSRMNFKGLVSWVDFKPIKNFNVILSLSYMHYATSHPVSIGLHGKIQIMGKLLKEEKKLEKDSDELKYGNKLLLELGPHEYSASFVKKIAQVASQRLLYVYPTFETFMRAFSQRLNKWRLSDFATFKKSTMVTDEDPGKRAYCFEEVIRLTKELSLNPMNAANYTPFLDLGKLVRYQQSEAKNRNVSIFVKDQQTGLREIFVLPINFRILVKSMEIFARLINETFPNETLSYPKRKDLVVAEHMRKSHVQLMNMKRSVRDKQCNVILLRYSSSSDAKAWCQQFCMPVFGCFITSLLFESFGQKSMSLIRYFCFILNQITGKHIHVDSRVKEWLKSTTLENASNESLKDLIDMYQGKLPGLYEDGSIINKSNMMQGIPHETSSSLHSSYLLFMTMVLKSLISEQLPKRLKHIKLGMPVVDSLVSSDDSGILFSLPVAVEEEHNQITKSSEMELQELKTLLYKLGYTIEINKKLFSAEASIEKSTIFAETPVFEFNSRFYIGRSIATAEIKFAVSSLTLGFHTRIVDRITEALSSLKGCVKEGLKQDQLMVLQQCLRRMHIRYLYADWWNSDLCERLDRSQSPRLGILPLVRRGMIGFLNLNMISDYALILNSPSYHPIRRSVQNLIDDTDNYSLTLRVGRKYLQTLKSLRISKPELLAELKALHIDPIRFLKRELPESMLIKLKLLNPGARIALSYVDLSKIHMASCYASTTQCITHKGEKKLSLMECLEIEDLEVPIPNIKSVTNLTSEIKYIDDLLNRGYEEDVEKDQTKISTEIIFSDQSQDYYSLLIKGWETGFSEYETQILAQIRELIPGLCDTLEETLQNFDSLFELESKIRSIDQKPFSVNVLSFTSGTKNFVQSYQTYLRSNWSRNHSFVIHGAAIQEVREKVLLRSRSDQWFNEIISDLSLISGSIKHPPIDRKLISLLQDKISDCRLSTENISGDMKEILLFLNPRNKFQRFDLRSFRSTKRKIIGHTIDEVFIFDRGNWYILRREMNTWTLYKDEQSPRLPYVECKYVIRENLPIWISPSELRVKIDKIEGLTIVSNSWNSECCKGLKAAFPHLRAEDAWVEIKPSFFNFSSYLEKLPKEYQTELCLKLLSSVHLDADRSSRTFDYWVMLSDIIAGSGYTKEEKSLSRCIMTIATEEDKQEQETYDPFEEILEEEPALRIEREDLDELYSEMLNWAEMGETGSEEDRNTGTLDFGFDFGGWCIDDIMEEFQEKGSRSYIYPKPWHHRIRFGYANSFRVYQDNNKHNPDRLNKIREAKGKLVFLNPEKFGEKLPD